jgi:hypothetical protein
MNGWHFVPMSDPAYLIGYPLGEVGSGRVRYGAAMALHRAGKLSDAQLEVYRIASAHDRQDPSALLAERGLPAPPGLTADPAWLIAHLTEEATCYVAGLKLPGA